MVENHNRCVLQWAGHAGYVAERFSGLLARQALVDVTLICEEQKLRVHKLVLASNSSYFEEILQQDLGQDPIILLRDLNFEILKAMVEFMYCGETTVSQENLSSLLSASRIFKVKELAYIIDTVMESQSYSSAIESVTQMSTDKELNLKNKNFKKSKSEVIGKKCQLEEGNRSIHNSDNTFKHTLYEDSYETESNVQNGTDSFLDVKEDAKEKFQEESRGTTRDRSKKVNTKKTEIVEKVKEVQPLLYEQCYDVLDINISDKFAGSLPQTCAQEVTQNFVDKTPDKVGKCIKVYTHKKRKPVANAKNKLTCANDLVPNLSPTNSIDLLDTPSSDSIPDTLLTPLDMDSTEYLFTLDNENMQSVAEGLINEQRSLLKRKELSDRANAKPCNDCVLSIRERNIDKTNGFNLRAIREKIQETRKPVLRRSVRLNQQETEYLTNGSIHVQRPVVTEKLFERTNFPAGKAESFPKGRRKIKETGRKVTGQNLLNISRCGKKCFGNHRAHRTAPSKAVAKKNLHKSTCGESVNKERSEQRSKTSNRMKCEMTDDMGSPFRQSAVGHISRALWGDMSDIVERKNDIIDLEDYSPNGEIPFAVGLLPLRTALEKMQAMPDYQPRKTRSSVAPVVKQETANPKRKNCSLDSGVFPKKQNIGSIVQNDKTNTVCHIQIRAAPSQYIKSRKKFLSEHVATLSPAAIVNRQ